MSSGSTKERGNGHGVAPAYFVPALEKGLDVLECLAAQSVPLTQAQLARTLNRRASELFRVLTTLERRGYVRRDPISGAYGLTLHLYELSHAHSPYEGLMRAAERPMRGLADAARESCHLSVINRGRVLVLCEEMAPARVRLSIEVGSTIPLLRAASGRLLLAHLDDARQQETLVLDTEAARLPITERSALHDRLTLIRARGYEEASGETFDGVSDLAVLVGSAGARVQAALAITGLARDHAAFVEGTLPALRRCAAAITTAAALGLPAA